MQDSTTKKILVKLYDCLILASILSNSYLTFHLKDTIYNNSKLKDALSNITKRSITSPFNILSADGRDVYMVRFTRFYLPMMLDLPYLHELSAILGATPSNPKKLNYPSDVLLSLICCESLKNRISLEDPTLKQFTYATSLACVFAEDVEFIVKSSPIFHTHYEVLKKYNDGNSVCAFIHELVQFLHKANTQIASFEAHPKPPISFLHHIYGDADTNIHQRIHNYHTSVCEENKMNTIDVKISDFPNETISRFYSHLPPYSHLNAFNCDDDEIMTAVDNGLKPKTLYDIIPTNTIHNMFKEDVFKRCDCGDRIYSG
jgi:hypothetical protein